MADNTIPSLGGVSKRVVSDSVLLIRIRTQLGQLDPGIKKKNFGCKMRIRNTAKLHFV
jgi:hypothetical protein